MKCTFIESALKGVSGQGSEMFKKKTGTVVYTPSVDLVLSTQQSNTRTVSCWICQTLVLYRKTLQVKSLLGKSCLMHLEHRRGVGL